MRIHRTLLLLLTMVQTNFCLAEDHFQLEDTTLLQEQENYSLSITYSYDGANGPLIAYAEAGKGRELANPSYSLTLKYINPGRHVQTIQPLSRPSDSDKVITDKLILAVHAENGTFKNRFVQDRVIHWPARKISVSPREVQDVGLVEAIVYQEFPLAEQLYMQYLREKNASGELRLDAIWPEMAYRVRCEKNWQSSAFDEWQTQSPQSDVRKILTAFHWTQCADELSPRLWNRSAMELSQVKIMLSRSDALLHSLQNADKRQHPLISWLELLNTQLSGTDRSTVWHSFQMAITQNPDYVPHYVLMSKYLLERDAEPDWQGFTEVRTQLLKNNTEHPEVLALFLNEANRFAASHMTDIYSAGLVYWSDTKPAWKALLTAYPSNKNWNRYAAHACAAGDMVAYVDAMERTQGHLPYAWPLNYNPDICQIRLRGIS